MDMVNRFSSILNIDSILIPLIFPSCQKDNQNAQGCESVSPFQIELPTALDPARDLQRLNSLIVDHLEELDKFNTSLGNGNEDSAQTRKTISDLKDVALNLKQINARYKSALLREMKYGSMQHPIGDDNYLHMSRNGLAQQIQSVGSNFFCDPRSFT